VILGLMLIGVVLSVAQTGLLWASKRPFFDFSRVNPLSGLKRMFSMTGLMELVKSLAKLIVVAWVAYSYLNSNISQLVVLSQMDLMAGLAAWSNLAFGMVWQVGGAYLVIAIADYIWQRRQFMNQMKMSKEEVKEEYKQSEGDPYIKARVRAMQRQVSRQRMMAAVPRAEVVITNPIHLAVAIGYDADKMMAPKVLAKGAHFMAQKIVEIAKTNQVSVVQNVPLARAMYKSVEVDQEIPPELYMAMAEVMAYVYRVKGKSHQMQKSTV
jgi:flagellar biosynthetic protein FlhB